MSNMELQNQLRELKELRRLEEELQAEITAITNAVKAHMVAQGAEQLVAGEYKVTWKPCTTTRFDAALFKSTFPELYAQYCRRTEGRRFIVA